MTKREEKRGKVLGEKAAPQGGKKGPGLPLLMFGLTLAGLIAIGVVRNGTRPSGPAITGAQVESVQYESAARIEQTPIQVAQGGGAITIPLREIRSKRLVGFTYQGSAGSLPLLAYIAPSGRVVTAVSMCEPCNSTTFHIEGDQLVCNACGTRWSLEDLRGLAGGCLNYPPDPFPNTLSGDNVVVQEAAVASWKPRV